MINRYRYDNSWKLTGERTQIWDTWPRRLNQTVLWDVCIKRIRFLFQKLENATANPTPVQATVTHACSGGAENRKHTGLRQVERNADSLGQRCKYVDMDNNKSCFFRHILVNNILHILKSPKIQNFVSQILGARGSLKNCLSWGERSQEWKALEMNCSFQFG